MEQAMPPEGAPQEAPAEGGGEAQLSKLISNLGTGNQMLMEIVEGSGAPPEIMQIAAAYMQAYEALTDALGGAQGAPPQQGGGASKMVSQEQGGAAASPAGPGMRGG
jgi:hypothetical protein